MKSLGAACSTRPAQSQCLDPGHCSVVSLAQADYMLGQAARMNCFLPSLAMKQSLSVAAIT